MSERNSSISQPTNRNTTHGQSRTRVYKLWSQMKRRCENPKDTAFHKYGGRGIVVCERWRNSFETFLADVGPRPSRKYSLERLDNNGNYEPDNVKWATRTEQANNRRNGHLLTYKGKTQTIAMWCRELHLTYACLHSRLHYGWSVERALTAPVRKY